MEVSREGQRRVFHTLDLLRAVAALAVASHHLRGDLSRSLPGSPLAVDLFFILSGFVISHSYADRLATRRLEWRDFFLIRVIRLYPLYILGTLLMFALILIKSVVGHSGASGIGMAYAQLFFAILFLPTPDRFFIPGGPLYSLNNPAWSLFWELIVNFLYAIIVRRLTTAWLIAIIVLGALMVIFSSIHDNGLGASGWRYDTFFGGMSRVIFGFFCGIGIERLFRKGKLPRLNLPAGFSTVFLIAVFALKPADRAVYDAVAVLIILPPLVAFSLGDPPRWMVPICSKLGVASYAIYALQMPFNHRFSNADHSAAMQLLLLGGLTAFALTTDAVYDKPVRRFLSTFFKRATRAKP